MDAVETRRPFHQRKFPLGHRRTHYEGILGLLMGFIKEIARRKENPLPLMPAFCYNGGHEHITTPFYYF